MLRIRRVEEALVRVYPKQEIRCPMHLSIGQEAVAVGVCENLTIEDKVFSSHRAHAHYLAKGGNLNRFIAELYGKDWGCSKGYGGSMHLTDLEVGFIGSTPIVGGTIPLAVGSAWRAKLVGHKDISVVFFGDGCSEEGVLHESLNFASLHKLPILFICENNGYSVYTPLHQRQPQRQIANIARAHGVDAEYVDGNDVKKVSEIVQKHIFDMHKNQKPKFLELYTHRWLEHCGPNDDDMLGYRKEGELKKWKKRCPLKKTKLLLEGLLSTNDFHHMEEMIAREIEEAFTFAKNSPNPTINKKGQMAHYARAK